MVKLVKKRPLLVFLVILHRSMMSVREIMTV